MPPVWMTYLDDLGRFLAQAHQPESHDGGRRRTVPLPPTWITRLAARATLLAGFATVLAMATVFAPWLTEHRFKWAKGALPPQTFVGTDSQVSWGILVLGVGSLIVLVFAPRWPPAAWLAGWLHLAMAGAVQVTAHDLPSLSDVYLTRGPHVWDWDWGYDIYLTVDTLREQWRWGFYLPQGLTVVSPVLALVAGIGWRTRRQLAGHAPSRRRDRLGMPLGGGWVAPSSSSGR